MSEYKLIQANLMVGTVADIEELQNVLGLENRADVVAFCVSHVLREARQAERVAKWSVANGFQEPNPILLEAVRRWQRKEAL